MKLRQGEMKKTMKGILAGAFLLAVGSAAVFAVGTETGLMRRMTEVWPPAGRRLTVSGITWTGRPVSGTAIRLWMRPPSAIW